MVDFAGALRKFGAPYYLKIDIEGCDTVCVRSLAEFKERPDYVSIESDKFTLAKVRSERRACSGVSCQGLGCRSARSGGSIAGYS